MGVQVRREHMRVATGPATSDRQIDVYNPYTNEICGTVPKASVADVEAAFRVANAYRPELSRSQRSEILRKTADLLVARKQEIAELITAESGLCLKDTIYEVGRAYDVFFLSSTYMRSSPSGLAIRLNSKCGRYWQQIAHDYDVLRRCPALSDGISIRQQVNDHLTSDAISCFL